METDHVALKTLALATAGVLAVEALARWAILRGLAPPLAGIGAARALDIALMAALISTGPSGWRSVGIGRHGWAAGLGRGLLWSAGFGALAALGFAAAHLAGLEPLRLIRPAAGARGAEAVLFFAVGAFISPVAEEIYFRGILYGFLRRWGFWPALVLSTVVFAFLHPGPAGIPFTQIVGGLLFGAAFEIEKRLIVPITIHVLGNLAIFSLAYV